MEEEKNEKLLLTRDIEIKVFLWCCAYFKILIRLHIVFIIVY